MGRGLPDWGSGYGGINVLELRFEKKFCPMSISAYLLILFCTNHFFSSRELFGKHYPKMQYSMASAALSFTQTINKTVVTGVRSRVGNPLQNDSSNTFNFIILVKH